jgi:hypothetical protein
MKLLRSYLFISALAFCALACEKTCGCSPAPELDVELSGRWELTRIKYGLTGKVVTAQEAGYKETLDYASDGKFRRLKNDKEEETGSYSTSRIEALAGFNFAIYYSNTTYQPYRVQENTLSLYERSPNGGVLADGATYEYKKL